jgi:hypothetical protein
MDEQRAPEPRGRLPAVASLVCLTAAALTLVSTFLPLFVGDLAMAGQTMHISITSWTSEGNGLSNGPAPGNGFPLVFATVGLLVAALTGLVAAVAPNLRRAAGVATGMAAAFLAAATWMVIVQVDGWLQVQSADGMGMSVDVGAGGGMWTLLAAAVVAILAAVLWLVASQRRPPEPPTPPTGIAVPVILPNKPPN